MNNHLILNSVDESEIEKKEDINDVLQRRAQEGSPVMFVLPDQKESGTAGDPLLAIMACPRCGTIGYISLQQIQHMRSIICGSNECSAEWYLNVPHEEIDECYVIMRKPM